MAKDVQDDGEVDVADLKIETLTGDIRDAMLMHFRNQSRPWSLMVEQEQREVANSFESAAGHLVRQVVAMLTDYDFPRTAVVLGEVKIKGEKGIEAKITCQNIEHNRAVLGEHVGQLVSLVMVDSETFEAERAPADIRPDQAEMLPDGDE